MLFIILLAFINSALAADVTFPFPDDPRTGSFYWDKTNDDILVLGKDVTNTNDIAFVYERDSTTSWTKLQELPVYGGFGASGDKWTSKASIDGGVILIADKNWPYPEGDYSGRVLMYQHNGTYYDLYQDIRPDVEIVGNDFGSYMEADGDWLAVAASVSSSSEDDKLYMFKFNGTYYEEHQLFTFDNPTNREVQHIRINGNYMAVSAPEDQSDAGSVKYFEYNSTFWEQKAKVVGQSAGTFGTALAIYQTTVVVGDPDQNSVFIYNYNGTDLDLTQTLTGDNTGDQYGYQVRLSNDASTLFVSAPSINIDGTPGTAEGGIYIYSLNVDTYELLELRNHETLGANSTEFGLVFDYKDSEQLILSAYLEDFYLSGLTDAPTTAPSVSPTSGPTTAPTANPTTAPTDAPTPTPVCTCTNGGICPELSTYCHCPFPYYGETCQLSKTCTGCN